MRYDIHLSISYDYETAAEGGRHVLRMMPVEIAGVQRVIAASQDYVPRPAEWSSRFDFFGNPFVDIRFEGAQKSIRFDIRARVERLLSHPPKGASPLASQIAALVADVETLNGTSPHHFIGESNRIHLHPDFTEYARSVIASDMPMLDVIETLGRALHRDMTFNPDATDVDTPAIEAFHNRQGVCQDFSHIMISALRGLGIPAGYVSGFLRTDPPAGQPRLEGADAMHAWVQVWAGAVWGWIEYDPTNAIFALTDHVVIARGRDYSDVSPIKGMTRTAGSQTTQQSVTVTPLD